MNKISLVFISCLLALCSRAETIKNITVSGKEAFTDHLSLKNDARDMDLMVKFVFDEAGEALTVSLISYRDLFVFQEDTRYKQAVGCRRKLKTDKLPYVVSVEEGQKFRLSKDLKRSVPKPRKKYVFKRWINYSGLIPQPAEFKMVNDYIEQKFDIKNKQNNVVVNLHDVFLMEKNPRKAQHYSIVFGKDLDTKYLITLQRDPCLGKEEELKTARQALTDITLAFRPFFHKYQGKTVESEEALSAFHETKKSLLQQFPQRAVDFPCDDLRQVWQSYNNYVDSIAAINCHVAESYGEVTAGHIAAGTVPAVQILSLARQIDVYVAKWQLSGDQAEQNDLEQECRNLITQGKEALRDKAATTDEQKRAVTMFRNAERYFNKTCKKR